MNPSQLRGIIQYIQTKPNIRNSHIPTFLKENEYTIPINNYYCFCLGKINNEKIVHVIRFHFRLIRHVTNYFLEWIHPITLASTSFWVHSGVTLRTKFFMYEDHLSFARSTFLYDPQSQSLIRLQKILPYITLPYRSIHNEKIFTDQNHYYLGNDSIHEPLLGESVPSLSRLENKWEKEIHNTLHNLIQENTSLSLEEKKILLHKKFQQVLSSL